MSHTRLQAPEKRTGERHHTQHAHFRLKHAQTFGRTHPTTVIRSVGCIDLPTTSTCRYPRDSTLRPRHRSAPRPPHTTPRGAIEAPSSRPSSASKIAPSRERGLDGAPTIRSSRVVVDHDRTPAHEGATKRTEMVSSSNFRRIIKSRRMGCKRSGNSRAQGSRRARLTFRRKVCCARPPARRASSDSIASRM